MARAKVSRKKVVKKSQRIQGNLQKEGSSAFGRKESEHNGEIPNEISSAVPQKPAVQALQTAGSSTALPESTPYNQSSRAVLRVKKLTDVFTKLPNNSISAAEKNDKAKHANAFQSSTAKENRAVSVSDPPNSAKSANVEKVGAAVAEQDVGMEQGGTIESISDDNGQHTSHPRKQQQRAVKLYYYPVESKEKPFKDEQAKPKPYKRHATKKARTLATDELTEVLLWEHPSKKRTLKDLTDLEVAFTVFKHTVEEFRECVSNRNILKLINKYEEYFERSILEKLQSIEDTKTMLQEINKFKKENKALSLKLGSLTDRKIKLQYEIAKRRAPRQK